MISVSDAQGHRLAAGVLHHRHAAPTNGSATLSWTPPTQNTDGSALTNLAGYRILYGTSASALTQTIEIANPGLATYVVTGLSSGNWYLRREGLRQRRCRKR